MFESNSQLIKTRRLTTIYPPFNRQGQNHLGKVRAEAIYFANVAVSVKYVTGAIVIAARILLIFSTKPSDCITPLK